MKKNQEPRLKFNEVQLGTSLIVNELPRHIYINLLEEYAYPWGYDNDLINICFVYYHIQNNKELYLQYVTNEIKRNIILKEIQDAKEKKKRERWYAPFLRKKRDE